MSPSLSPAARRLLWMNGLFTLANGLSGMFANVYVWRLRPGVATLAHYQLWIALAILVVLPLLGAVVKRRGAVLALVLGTGLHAGFYLLLLLLQERAALHLEALGMFMGCAISSYALAGHVLTYDVTTAENREHFYNRSGMVNSVSGLLAPLLSGWLIVALPDLLGYRAIFTVSTLLFAASSALGLGLKVSWVPSEYRLWRVLPGSKPAWRRMLLANGVMGLRDALFGFLISLLVYLAVGDESSVGNFAFITSAVGIGAFWLAGRIMTPANRHRLFPIGALGMAAACGLLALGASWPVILGYGLLTALAQPLWNTAFAAQSFAVIQETGGAIDLRVEMICAREVPLNLGRILVLSIVTWWGGAGAGDIFLRTLLPLLGLTFPVMWLLVRARTGELPSEKA